MSLLTPAKGLETIIDLMEQVERIVPGSIIAVDAVSSETDYTKELPSCTLTIRHDRLSRDLLNCLLNGQTFEVGNTLRFRVVSWQPQQLAHKQHINYRLEIRAISIVQEAPTHAAERSCENCARSYKADGLLHCGAGSTQDPLPYWATEAAFRRILIQDGKKTGMERADDIDPKMATECAAFER